MSQRGVRDKMRGFPADLEANNEKTCFEANRGRYMQAFLAPAEELVTALGAAGGGDRTPCRTPGQCIDQADQSRQAVQRRQVTLQVQDAPDLLAGREADDLTGAASGHPDGSGWRGGGALDVRQAGTGPISNRAAGRGRACQSDGGTALASAVPGQVLADPALKRVPHDRTDNPAGDLYRCKGLVVRGTCPPLKPPLRVLCTDTGATCPLRSAACHSRPVSGGSMSSLPRRHS